MRKAPRQMDCLQPSPTVPQSDSRFPLVRHNIRPQKERKQIASVNLKLLDGSSQQKLPLHFWDIFPFLADKMDFYCNDYIWFRKQFCLYATEQEDGVNWTGRYFSVNSIAICLNITEQGVNWTCRYFGKCNIWSLSRLNLRRK